MLKQQKTKIIVALCLLLFLAFTYCWGGNAPGLHGWNPVAEPSPTAVLAQPTASSDSALVSAPVSDTEISQNEAVPTASPGTTTEAQAPQSNLPPSDSAAPEMQIDAATGTDLYQTEPVPSGKPIPVEPENTSISDKQLTCTLSVRCDTILAHMDWLTAEKAELVPADGVLFPAQTVVFYEGESVFNVLVREMKRNKIHLEFENTPIYHSAYIEGIGNLYEFDCGELSGWMYKVNGWFPNYGCSRYQLHAGDTIEWVYTCNLGEDVGGEYNTGNGR